MDATLQHAGADVLNSFIGAQPGMSVLEAQKRLPDGDGQMNPDGKRQRTGEVEFRGRGWTCPKCGNLNRENRVVCNMRHCQAPRPIVDGQWLCSCGNMNYATRTVCGMRRCGLQRPGAAVPPAALALGEFAPAALASAALQPAALTALDAGAGRLDSIITALAGEAAGVGAQLAVAQSSMLPMNDPTLPPEGSWTCIRCKNINWPTRTTCNGKNCGWPRAEVDAGPPSQTSGQAPLPPPAVAPPPLMALQASRPAQVDGAWANLLCGAIGSDVDGSLLLAAQQAQLEAQQQQALLPQIPETTIMPEGSWLCLGCRNMNFPTHDRCARVACNRARVDVDGGCLQAPQHVNTADCEAALQEALRAAKAATPEGSWKCTACGNINFPTRDVCNGRNCARPRHEVDGGMPQGVRTRPAQQIPTGSWICAACRNVNFPTRDSCNGKHCGRPRAEVDGGPAPGSVASATVPLAAGPALGGLAAPLPPPATLPPQASMSVAQMGVSSAGQQGVPDGSWTCGACGNVNFPTRDRCNRRACGLPRSVTDGGASALGQLPPQQQVLAAPELAPNPNRGGEMPAGSWRCTACRNANFPTRDRCNGRNCGRPRSEVDGGPVVQL